MSSLLVLKENEASMQDSIDDPMDGESVSRRSASRESTPQDRSSDQRDEDPSTAVTLIDPVLLGMPEITEFLAKIRVKPQLDRFDVDDLAMMVVRGTLDASATVASRALAVLKPVLKLGSVNFVDRLFAQAQKLDFLSASPTNNVLLNILLALSEHNRVNPCKAAIGAVEAAVIYLKNDELLEKCLEMLRAKCCDHSLTIRKQAAESLTAILPHFRDSSATVSSVWLHSVFMAITDRELPVQQHCAKLVLDVLIHPLVRGGDHVEHAWQMLNTVERELELKRGLSRIIFFLHREKLLPSTLVRVMLKNTAVVQRANAAWLIVSEMSRHQQINSIEAVNFFTNLRDYSAFNTAVQYVSNVVAHSAKLLLVEQLDFLRCKTDDALSNYKLATCHITSVYYAFINVCEALKPHRAVSDDSDETSGADYASVFTRKWFDSGVRQLEELMYEENTGITAMPSAFSSDHDPQPLGDIVIIDNDDADGDDGRAEVHPLPPPPLFSQVSSGPTASQREEREKKSAILERIIYSLGECVQGVGNGVLQKLHTKRLFKLLKVLIASDVLQEASRNADSATPFTPTPVPPSSLNTTFTAVDGGGSQPPPSQNPSRPTSGLTAASSQPLSSCAASTAIGVRSRPTASQSTAFNFDVDDHNDEDAELDGRNSVILLTRIGHRVLRTDLLLRNVRAQAVLTLGKLCLVDDRLAKKCVPVFVRQLKENTDHIVRNNIVIVICDLCIRYTSLVDRYSGILASCLKDQSVLIRQQTLLLLTNLIKEQFLKWEGPIICRFITTLLDPNVKIRQYVEFCMYDVLLPQFPMMFFNHFLEMIFYFNDVHHQSWKIGEEDAEDDPDVDYKSVGETISLAGWRNSKKRMTLYKSMMKTFTDDQRYKLSERICAEVIAEIRDGGSEDEEPINRDGMLLFNHSKVKNIVIDVLKILRSDELRLSMQVGKRDVDDKADEDDPPENVTKEARKLISKVFGTKLVEATMPHLLTLKGFLEERRSPMVNEVFHVILDLYKHYHQHFDEIFAAEPQLQAELTFQLKRERTAAAAGKNNASEEVIEVENNEQSTELLDNDQSIITI